MRFPLRLFLTFPACAALISAAFVTAASADDKAAAPTTKSAPAKPESAKVAVAKPQDPNAVAATYNGKKITFKDIESELDKPAYKMMAGAMASDPAMKAQLMSSVLNQMINRNLLLEAARKAGNVTPADIEKESETFIASQGGKPELEGKLKQIGLTYEAFLKDLKDDIHIKLFLDKDVTGEVAITDEQATQFFKENEERFGQPEQVRASHVLLSVPKTSTPEQEKAVSKKADELYEEATKSDADFGKIAAANSDDPGSKARGGDLGFFGKGMMVPEFEKAAFELKAGEVSKPVKSAFGYHIIKLVEHKEAQAPDFAKVKEQVVETLKMQQKGELVKGKIEDLRKMAKVDVKIPTPS